MRRWFLTVAGVIVALLVWHLIVSRFEPTLLPRPVDVWNAVWDNRQLLINGVVDSSWRLLRGLLVGFAGATTIAIISARWLDMRHFLDGPIEFIRPIPPIALTPFFILLLGLEDASQIGLVALGTFMIFYIGWLEGLRRTPDALVNSARSLGYEGFRLVLLVAIPYAWPSQKPIWRLAIATGLSLCVAAEYLGAQGGLGFLIRNARTMLDFSLIAAASIALGGVAIIVDHLVTLIIDLTSSWSQKSERFDG